jgi:L-gulonate 5-dehydrogenase
LKGRVALVTGGTTGLGFIPQVVEWFAQGCLKSAGTITQTFPAEDARLAFDLAENEPGHTIKVHLDFTG